MFVFWSQLWTSDKREDFVLEFLVGKWCHMEIFLGPYFLYYERIDQCIKKRKDWPLYKKTKGLQRYSPPPPPLLDNRRIKNVFPKKEEFRKDLDPSGVTYVKAISGPTLHCAEWPWGVFFVILLAGGDFISSQGLCVTYVGGVSRHIHHV